MKYFIFGIQLLVFSAFAGLNDYQVVEDNFLGDSSTYPACVSEKTQHLNEFLVRYSVKKISDQPVRYAINWGQENDYICKGRVVILKPTPRSIHYAADLQFSPEQLSGLSITYTEKEYEYVAAAKSSPWREREKQMLTGVGTLEASSEHQVINSGQRILSPIIDRDLIKALKVSEILNVKALGECYLDLQFLRGPESLPIPSSYDRGNFIRRNRVALSDSIAQEYLDQQRNLHLEKPSSSIHALALRELFLDNHCGEYDAQSDEEIMANLVFNNLNSGLALKGTVFQNGSRRKKLVGQDPQLTMELYYQKYLSLLRDPIFHLNGEQLSVEYRYRNIDKEYTGLHSFAFSGTPEIANKAYDLITGMFDKKDQSKFFYSLLEYAKFMDGLVEKDFRLGPKNLAEENLRFFSLKSTSALLHAPIRAIRDFGGKFDPFEYMLAVFQFEENLKKQVYIKKRRTDEVNYLILSPFSPAFQPVKDFIYKKAQNENFSLDFYIYLRDGIRSLTKSYEELGLNSYSELPKRNMKRFFNSVLFGGENEHFLEESGKKFPLSGKAGEIGKFEEVFSQDTIDQFKRILLSRSDSYSDPIYLNSLSKRHGPAVSNGFAVDFEKFARRRGVDTEEGKKILAISEYIQMATHEGPKEVGRFFKQQGVSVASLKEAGLKGEYISAYSKEIAKQLISSFRIGATNLDYVVEFFISNKIVEEDVALEQISELLHVHGVSVSQLGSAIEDYPLGKIEKLFSAYLQDKFDFWRKLQEGLAQDKYSSKSFVHYFSLPFPENERPTLRGFDWDRYGKNLVIYDSSLRGFSELQKNGEFALAHEVGRQLERKTPFAKYFIKSSMDKFKFSSRLVSSPELSVDQIMGPFLKIYLDSFRAVRYRLDADGLRKMYAVFKENEVDLSVVLSIASQEEPGLYLKFLDAYSPDEDFLAKIFESDRLLSHSYFPDRNVIQDVSFILKTQIENAERLNYLSSDTEERELAIARALSTANIDFETAFKAGLSGLSFLPYSDEPERYFNELKKFSSLYSSGSVTDHLQDFIIPNFSSVLRHKGFKEEEIIDLSAKLIKGSGIPIDTLMKALPSKEYLSKFKREDFRRDGIKPKDLVEYGFTKKELLEKGYTKMQLLFVR